MRDKKAKAAYEFESDEKIRASYVNYHFNFIFLRHCFYLLILWNIMTESREIIVMLQVSSLNGLFSICETDITSRNSAFECEIRVTHLFWVSQSQAFCNEPSSNDIFPPAGYEPFKFFAACWRQPIRVRDKSGWLINPTNYQDDKRKVFPREEVK